MTLFRSRLPNPSSLLSSNNRFICRPGTAVSNLRDAIAFLPNDSKITLGVCEIGYAHQQAPELDKRCQIDARHADRHLGTNHGIEHPTRDRYDDAQWPPHLKELTSRSLFDATHQNLPAEIRVTPVTDFQLLPDMGRMNG
jgi:hypothetical protein